MYLTSRRIRSAGRKSGSIEITLPAELEILEGVECRLMVRDGPRPEIVLQPDFSAVQALLQALWEKLRLGLGEIGEIGEFSPADFRLALFPPGHWQDHPPLAYIDALALLHQRSRQGDRHPEALARLLTHLAVAASYRLDLKAWLALAYGDAVAYLITGISAGLGTEFERGMAHWTFWSEGPVQEPLGSPFEDESWRQARPGFRRVYDQFWTWQENPEVYASAREKWYRALMAELLRMPLPEGHPERMALP